MSREIPPALKKRGIRRVTDNLEPGQELATGKAVWLFFGDEIMRRATQQGQANGKRATGD